MTEEKRSRRRRGRRRGQQRDAETADGAQQPEPAADTEQPRARRDTRRTPGAPPSPSNPSTSIRRSPSEPRRQQRDDRGRRGRDDGSRDRGRDRGPSRDRSGPRSYEPIVPQDETSIALGAAFKEAQTAVRDARKALDKRKAEHGDEPDWLVAQLEDAERRFEEAATEWSEHLSTTGRKVVRR